MFSGFEPFSINISTALLQILFLVPFHPECTKPINYFSESYIEIGTQSAV